MGDRTISTARFQRVYMPLILHRERADSPEWRQEVLDQLIYQKVIAQEAEKIQLDTMAIVRRAAQMAERQAVTRILYDEWVHKRIPAPTDQELWDAFIRSRTRLLVRHLAVSTRAKADSLYQLLATGRRTFNELAGDTFEDMQLRTSGGLLGWVTFGDLDENLENAMFNLTPGVPSEPVRSPYGWHILRVDDSRRQIAFDEREFRRRKENLATKLLLRRERRLGKQVLTDYMQSRNIEFNRVVADQVWELLAPRLREMGRFDQAAAVPLLGAQQRELGRELDYLLDQLLVTFEGGSWTVAQLLDRLPNMKPSYLTGNLYYGTAYLIRDELLAREGYDQGYDRDPQVLLEVQDRKDEILEQLYLKTIMDTVILSRARVLRYYQENWERRYHSLDSIRIQEIRVTNKGLADSLMHQLRQGSSFAELARLAGRSPDAVTDDGDLGWQAAGNTRYPEFYDQVLRATLNVPLGPIRTDWGWSIIRGTDRRRYPKPFNDIQDQVLEDLQRELFEILRREVARKNMAQYQIETNREILQAL
ncbi:MAG: peptidylprolyl isomerase [Candidatus Marinimicrobia bacterium]|nr:peptidylprolyl isomerase [Candidatus Neomarinimicrobiota bacterium]